MTWNINRKISSAFLAVIVVVAIMSGFTYYEVGQLNELHIQSAKVNLEKMALSQGIAADIANEAVAMRRFNFTGDSNDITIFNGYRTQADEKLKRLDAMLALESNKAVVREIQKEKTAYENIAAQSFEAKKANDIAAVGRYMDEAGTPFKASMAAAMKMVGNVDDFVKADQLVTNAKATSIQRTLLIVNILVAIIALGIGRYISRKLSRPAQAVSAAAAAIAAGDLSQADIQVDSSDEIGELGRSFNAMKGNLRDVIRTVASSAEHVAASSEELTSSAEQSALASDQTAQAITAVAQSATSQLQSIDQTSAVVQTLSAGLEEAAASVHEVNDQSIKASQAAANGALTVAKTVEQMQQIEKTVAFTAEMVGRLGESSKEIGQIVDTISGIAAQTNLLALNAAIEAARAGEQGRGFAVVAEEVRHLAEQSQEAAKQITDLISNIQNDTEQAVASMDNGTKEVKAGVDAVHETGADFQRIDAIVQHVADQMREMTAVIEHMAEGSQQIVTAVAEIDNLSKNVASESQHVAAVTQEQSASAQEISTSSQGLADMAQELQLAVSRFRL